MLILQSFFFDSLRYFIGDDAMEYCWKTLKGLGYIVSSPFAFPHNLDDSSFSFF